MDILKNKSLDWLEVYTSNQSKILIVKPSLGARREVTKSKRILRTEEINFMKASLVRYCME